jgi:hypothetical protein
MPDPRTDETPVWRPLPPVPLGRHARDEEDWGAPTGPVYWQQEQACPTCGRPPGSVQPLEPPWNKWWFWLLVLLIVCVIMGNLARL